MPYSLSSSLRVRTLLACLLVATSSRDVAVAGRTPRVLQEQPGYSPGVRLVEGLTARSGRLEVLHDGAWKTVCSDTFPPTAATEVCRKLGYSNGMPYIAGGGSGPILNVAAPGCLLQAPEACTHRSDKGPEGPQGSNVNCTAQEPAAARNCNHDRDVGVMCTGLALPLVAELVNSQASSGSSKSDDRAHDSTLSKTQSTIAACTITIGVSGLLVAVVVFWCRQVAKEDPAAGRARILSAPAVVALFLKRRSACGVDEPAWAAKLLPVSPELHTVQSAPAAVGGFGRRGGAAEIKGTNSGSVSVYETAVLASTQSLPEATRAPSGSDDSVSPEGGPTQGTSAATAGPAVISITASSCQQQWELCSVFAGFRPDVSTHGSVAKPGALSAGSQA